MYLNRLTLIGFIGGDAETKTISNGSTFTALSVATQRSWKNSEGAWESCTEWHRCVSFGKLADFAATLKKRPDQQGGVFTPSGDAPPFRPSSSHRRNAVMNNAGRTDEASAPSNDL
jgi:hypothetical protein